MGKRSNFERRERDHYPTPYSAVKPLLSYINPFLRYYEPCAGEGDLIRHLDINNIPCGGYSDIDKDARTYQYHDHKFDYFITNPPWDREILHPIIENLRKQKPTWLLFDADWMHTKQAIPHLYYCEKIISVGRVKWIPDSPHTGKDNCCWYQFVKDLTVTNFFGRT